MTTWTEVGKRIELGDTATFGELDFGEGLFGGASETAWSAVAKDDSSWTAVEQDT